MPERLQKLIARAGIASRRTAEKLIEAGAVRVNGRVVSELGAKADPERDRIEVEGRLLRFPKRDSYLVLNKPRGTVTTASDPEGRPTIFQRLRGLPQRMFPVGRLPYEVEGLLLLTSDGAFADAVLRGRLPQSYQLKLKGALTPAELATAREKAARRGPAGFELKLVKPGANPWYEAMLTEPRQDWLRTIFFRLGHPVEKVKRVGLGSLRLGGLRAGEFRELTNQEVERLRQEVAASSGSGRQPRRRAG
jgi:23S rRNA pseudouridine2605 synthase